MMFEGEGPWEKYDLTAQQAADLVKELLPSIIGSDVGYLGIEEHRSAECTAVEAFGLRALRNLKGSTLESWVYHEASEKK